MKNVQLEPELSDASDLFTLFYKVVKYNQTQSSPMSNSNIQIFFAKTIVQLQV